MATAADVKRASATRADRISSRTWRRSPPQARRLLEGDLGLEERARDDAERKAAVAKYVDRVLASGDGKTPGRPAETARPEKENRLVGGAQATPRAVERRRE